MLKLTIPQASQESGSARDLVFSILTREQALNMMQLYRRVNKGYNVSLTYQAVRKAIEALTEQGIIRKQGKCYSIDKRWVIQSKAFFDTLLSTIDGNTTVHQFTDQLKKEDYVMYTFHTLYDLDTFWGDVLVTWARNLKKGDNKQYFSYAHYTFWMLINLGRETKIFDEIMQKGVKAQFLLLDSKPLNKWSANIYREQGVQTVLRPDLAIDDSTGLNLLGDTVLQVHYPEKILKKLRTFYQNSSDIKSIDYQRITALAHEECEIKFTLFKNPSLARDIRERYAGYFD